VVVKNHIPLHHIAVLDARMTMGGEMRPRHHAEQRATFSAGRIFIKPRYGHSTEPRRLPVHLGAPR
jgi:hypothetical protein